MTVENTEELKEAMKAEADEVILTLKGASFSALKAFDKEEIISLCTQAHQNGIKASVLMDRLFDEDEISCYEDILRYLKDAADWFILSDLALMHTAEELGILSKVIYDPMTLMTSQYDADLWLSLGVGGVSVSALLTLDEVSDLLKHNASLSLPVFGYQPVSVSRRLLLKEMEEYYGLSDLSEKENLYIEEESRDYRFHIRQNEKDSVVYSDYILECFHEFKRFADAGLKRAVINSYHLDFNMCLDALALCRKLLNEEDSDIEAFFAKYPEADFKEGYLKWKTVK